MLLDWHLNLRAKLLLLSDTVSAATDGDLSFLTLMFVQHAHQQLAEAAIPHLIGRFSKRVDHVLNLAFTSRAMR